MQNAKTAKWKILDIYSLIPMIGQDYFYDDTGNNWPYCYLWDLPPETRVLSKTTDIIFIKTD